MIFQSRECCVHKCATEFVKIIIYTHGNNFGENELPLIFHNIGRFGNKKCSSIINILTSLSCPPVIRKSSKNRQQAKVLSAKFAMGSSSASNQL